MDGQGVQRIEFEGQVHEFPSDFTDADIQKALRGPTPQATPVPQQAAVPQPPNTPHQAMISADKPTMWDRARRALPIIDRIQTGLSGPAQTTAEALAKPLPGMSDERAIAPEQMMSPSAQQRHPILTGAGEFAGGMTTPENLLMSTMLAPTMPSYITRPIGGIFAASMLKGAAEQFQPFRDALARKDTSEAERLATHMMLGAIFGATAGRRAVMGEAGVPIYEDFRRRGQAIADYTRRAKSLNDVHKAGALLYGSKIREPLLTLQTRLQQDGVASLQPALDAERAAVGKGSILPVQAQGEVAKAIEETGYNPSGPERTLLDRLAADPGDQIAQGLGYKTASEARTKMGTAFDSYADQVSKAVPDAKSTGMTLDDAIKLRTSLGMAASKAERANNAKGGKVLWTAYNQLGEAIGQKVQDLTGSKTPFDNYNKNFRAAFELNKGFTGDLLDPILDHHEAIAKLKTFSEADLTGVANQYMKPKGIDSGPLFQAQRDAKSLLAANDAISGRLRKGLYRQIMSDTPSQALLPMGAYMAARGAGLYGFVPYMLATMVGKVAGESGSEIRAGQILRKLDIPINRKYLELRTGAPGGTETPAAPAAYQPRGPGFQGFRWKFRPDPELPSVSGGSVGTASGAAQDNAFFAQAKQEMPNASVSEQLLRAQQLKVRQGIASEPAPDMTIRSVTTSGDTLHINFDTGDRAALGANADIIARQLLPDLAGDIRNYSSQIGKREMFSKQAGQYHLQIRLPAEKLRAAKQALETGGEAAKPAPAGEDLIEEARRRGMVRPQSELQERAERIKRIKEKR